jgi:hypothetical protein
MCSQVSKILKSKFNTYPFNGSVVVTCERAEGYTGMVKLIGAFTLQFV